MSSVTFAEVVVKFINVKHICDHWQYLIQRCSNITMVLLGKVSLLFVTHFMTSKISTILDLTKILMVLQGTNFWEEANGSSHMSLGVWWGGVGWSGVLGYWGWHFQKKKKHLKGLICLRRFSNFDRNYS